MSNQTAIARAILAEYNTDMIRGKLLEFPGLIRDAKSKLRSVQEAFKALDMIRKEFEAGMIVDIAAEINPQTGKPAYSNEAARAAALAQMKSTNRDYTKLFYDARTVERNITEAQDDLDQLFDEYKSYGFIARLVANELALMADDPLECGGSVPVAVAKEAY